MNKELEMDAEIVAEYLVNSCEAIVINENNEKYEVCALIKNEVADYIDNRATTISNFFDGIYTKEFLIERYTEEYLYILTELRKSYLHYMGK